MIDMQGILIDKARSHMLVSPSSCGSLLFEAIYFRAPRDFQGRDQQASGSEARQFVRQGFPKLLTR
jgi:hypothetical protein